MKKKQVGKAILSVILTLAMVLSSAWVPQLAIRAKADAATETVISDQNRVTEWSGKMVVNEGARINGTVYLTGDTELTIAEGKQLTVGEIKYKEDYTGSASLTINGGKLRLTGEDKQGIQLGNTAEGRGTLTVNSGMVEIESGSGEINCASLALNGGSVELNGAVKGNITLAGGSINTACFYDNNATVAVAEGHTYLVKDTVTVISSGEVTGGYANSNYIQNGKINLVPAVAKHDIPNKGAEYIPALDGSVFNGGKVTLLSDVTISEPLVIDETVGVDGVILDLNGHTLDRGLTGKDAVEDGNVITIGEHGDFILTDNSTAGTGKIIGGNNNGDGGGVYINEGRFTMNGGTITGCSASRGGGVFVSNNGNPVFNVSGAPVIKGNTCDDKASNVVLDQGTAIFVTGDLTSGAELYVNPMEAGIIAKPAGDKTAITETETGYFHSDDTKYSPVLSEGKVVFKTAPVDIGKPVLNTGLMYDGTEHELVECRCTVGYGGTAMYAVTTSRSGSAPTEGWSSEIPTAKDAGTYYVWYYVKGDDSHFDTQKEKIGVDGCVVIAQQEVCVKEGITAENKTYDGKKTATLDTTQAVLDSHYGSICATDELTVTAQDGAGTFDDANAGENKTVTIDASKLKLMLDGKEAKNYVLASAENQETTTASISKMKLTITGVTAGDKEYDGETTATLKTENATVDGLAGSDTVDFKVKGTFADAAKGTNKTVTLSDWELTNGGTNYEIDVEHSQKTTTASITGIQVYISGTIYFSGKQYDGTDKAYYSSNSTPVIKKVSDDKEVSDLTVSDITGKFADKNAGENKTIKLTGAKLSNETNYTLVLEKTTGISANIGKCGINITGLAVADKIYDGSAEATITGTPGMSYKCRNDDVRVVVGTASFEDANVGENKTVTFSGFSLEGEDADNYFLSSSSLPTDVKATIKLATPTITAPVAKTGLTYDGTEQTLVDEGKVPTGCTMWYAVTDSTATSAPTEELAWTKTAPTATGAKTHKVWYKVDGGANYNNIAPKAIPVTIWKADQEAPVLDSSVTITSGDAVVISGVDASMEYSTDNKTWTACEEGLSLGKGVYYIRKKADENHNVGPVTTVVVKKEGEYALAVTGGTGSGSYETGATVSVKATAPAGEKFVKWYASGIDFDAEEGSKPELTITMPASDVTLEAIFTDLEVEGISLNKEATKLEVGKKETLTVSFQPAVVKDSHKKVTWESDNESVAIVDPEGHVTAVAEGTAIITVKSVENENAKAICAVTVVKASTGGGSSTGGGGSTGGGAGGGSTDKPADTDKPSDTDKPADTTPVEAAKDPSEGKIPAGKEETSTVTGKDGSVIETIKVENTDGSITEKEKVTAANGTVTEKTTVTEQDGTVKTLEVVEKTSGAKVERVSEVQANGDFETKTVKTNKKGEVTQTVTETKTTNEKTGRVTLTTETVKGSGATEESKVVTNADGDLTKASVTETTASGKTATVDLKTDKKGDVVVKNIDSTKTTVTIPDEVVDANGKAHEVKAITAKALSGESKVKTLIVSKNVEVFERNALKDSNVQTLELNSAPKFEKDSLKTGGKLTIIVHSKAVQKQVEKQLKKAGAPNAKVVLERKKK